MREPGRGRLRSSLLLALPLAVCAACTDASTSRDPTPAARAELGSAEGKGMTASAQNEDAYARQRERMVASQLERRGLKDPRVLAAMRKVPRHEFVPEHLRDQAYEDHPLPIGSVKRQMAL